MHVHGLAHLLPCSRSVPVACILNMHCCWTCWAGKLALLLSQVNNNKLTESQLPENWPLEMPKLANLSMDGNQLHGSVPTSWTNWGSLQVVYVTLQCRDVS